MPRAQPLTFTKYDFSDPQSPTLRTRGHRLSVTAATAPESCRYLYTAGKEGSIIRWDLHTGKLLNTFHKCRPHSSSMKGKETATGDKSEVKGHTAELLALAISSDGRYLVSAGKDRRIGVWDAEKPEWIRGFSGPLCHRDTVSVSSSLFRLYPPHLMSVYHRPWHLEKVPINSILARSTVRLKCTTCHRTSWAMLRRYMGTKLMSCQ